MAMLEPTYSTDGFTPASRRGPYRILDYFALPEEPRCELLFGRFYVVPSPNVGHQSLVVALTRILDDVARATGGKALCAPMDVVLSPHTVLQPDVLYVSPARLGIVRERIEGAPDLVVEILSPGTSRRDRGGKMQIYAEAGVVEYWIVDPVSEQVELYVNAGGAFTVVVPHNDRYRSAMLPGIGLDIAQLWADTTRRTQG